LIGDGDAVARLHQIQIRLPHIQRYQVYGLPPVGLGGGDIGPGLPDAGARQAALIERQVYPHDGLPAGLFWREARCIRRIGETPREAERRQLAALGQQNTLARGGDVRVGLQYLRARLQRLAQDGIVLRAEFQRVVGGHQGAAGILFRWRGCRGRGIRRRVLLRGRRGRAGVRDRPAGRDRRHGGRRDIGRRLDSGGVRYLQRRIDVYADGVVQAGDRQADVVARRDKLLLRIGDIGLRADHVEAGDRPGAKLDLRIAQAVERVLQRLGRHIDQRLIAQHVVEGRLHIQHNLIARAVDVQARGDLLELRLLGGGAQQAGDVERQGGLHADLPLIRIDQGYAQTVDID